jgi:quercetin dioxygenase-like cupin family protein
MNAEPRPVFRHPVTKEKSVVLTDPREHPEQVLLAHLTVEPGGRVAAPHWHPTLEERFLILKGQIGFYLDGEETVLGPGEHATVNRDVVHDWWQVGDEPAEALVEVVPGVRFVEMVGTLFGLGRDGKTDDKGMPTPLQLAVMGHEYDDTVVFTKPPALIRKTLLPLLAAVGRARGLKPKYDEYLEDEEQEVPDPTVFEHVTPEGRLKPFEQSPAGAAPG